MEVLHARCAGLDVHKKQVRAWVRVAEGGRVRREVRGYGMATADLLRLSEWLESEGVTHLTMEAPGRTLEARVARSGGWVQPGPGERAGR